MLVKAVHAKGLINVDGKLSGKSDPYLKISYPDGKSKRSKEISDSLNPVWNEVITKDINLDYDSAQELLFQVYDSDLVGDQLIGFV